MKRLLPVLPLLFLCSCSSYFMQRADDFGDTARFKLMGGIGLGIQAEVTRAIIFGAGYYEVDSFGFANRSFGIWHERVREGGVFAGFHREDVSEGRDYYRGNYGFNASPEGRYSFHEEESGCDFWNLRATIHLVVVGADLELRLGQILDFITGIFGYDMARDDYDFEAVGAESPTS